MRDYARNRRMMRRNRNMDYGYYGVRGGKYYPMDGNYSNSQYNDERGRRDYESGRQYDMGYDYPRMNDGHYGSEGKTYYPIEAMGTFNGYWGQPQRDFGRYDMRGRDMMGDYGETLTKDELEYWSKKMLKDVDEKHKQFFTKENISQKARTLGISMEYFNEDELLTASLAMYTDYCEALKPYIGDNLDVYIKLGKSFMLDKDASVKGGEKLAVYFDNIVEGDF